MNAATIRGGLTGKKEIADRYREDMARMQAVIDQARQINPDLTQPNGYHVGSMTIETGDNTSEEEPYEYYY